MSKDTNPPRAFTMDGKLYSWEHGCEIAWIRPPERVLVANLNTIFWTWIDELGDRAWSINPPPAKP